MKTITRVFLVIAALLFSLVVWGLFFNSNGVLETGYNALIKPVNETWATLSGSSDDMLPEWKIKNSDGLDQDANNQMGN